MADNRGEKPVVHTKKHIARLERERRQTRLILFSFIGILVVAVALLLYGYLDISYFQLQKPVAKVGDVSITTREFQTRVKIQREGLINQIQQYSVYQQYGIDVSAQVQQMQDQLDNTETLGQNVLNSMIDEQLIQQEAAKRGITVSDQEVEDAIQAAQGYFPNGTPTPTVTPTEVVMPTDSPDILKYVTPTSEFTATPAFTPTLELPTATPGTLVPETALAGTGTLEPSATATATATLEPTATPTETLVPTPTLSGSPTPEPTATPYTLDAYQKNYKTQIDHFARYGLTEEMYRKLFKVDLLRKKLYEQVTADVPHTEQQVRARHILVQSEVEAQAVIEELKNGMDFGEIAAKRSLDTASGAQGGDLGWFGHGAMVAPFEEAAFSLKVGEISAPVQSTFGFHVIQVIAREDRPLDASGYQQATDKAFSDFLQSLREPYKVETFDDVWKKAVPTAPSFASLATEAAQTAKP
jgi:parvulin-like peptidyl-prolyl isomerase